MNFILQQTLQKLDESPFVLEWKSYGFWLQIMMIQIEMVNGRILPVFLQMNSATHIEQRHSQANTHSQLSGHTGIPKHQITYKGYVK